MKLRQGKMGERLNYAGVRRIPEVFTDNQINLIFSQILSSKGYWKGAPTDRFKKGHNLKEWGNFFKHRDLCLIATIYLLALRPKEACCLRFDDFNWSSTTVKIRGSSNKCRKDRVIPVPQLLLKFYDSYFAFPKDRFWKGSPYLFPSFSNQHISPSTLKFIMREKCLKPLGLWHCQRESKAQYRTIYKLRHTRASKILKQQVEKHGAPDLYAIANILGHSDIRSTTVYLHTDEKYMNYLRDEMEI